MKSTLMAALVALSFGASAQAVTDAPPAKTEPPKKAAAKKAEPKKTEAKKTEVKKPAPPKKPPASKAPPAPTKTTVYKNDPNAPILRDKQGNVIPTDPNAYDVSSAVGPKK